MGWKIKRKRRPKTTPSAKEGSNGTVDGDGSADLLGSGCDSEMGDNFSKGKDLADYDAMKEQLVKECYKDVADGIRDSVTGQIDSIKRSSSIFHRWAILCRRV